MSTVSADDLAPSGVICWYSDDPVQLLYVQGAHTCSVNLVGPSDAI